MKQKIVHFKTNNLMHTYIFYIFQVRKRKQVYTYFEEMPAMFCLFTHQAQELGTPVAQGLGLTPLIGDRRDTVQYLLCYKQTSSTLPSVRFYGMSSLVGQSQLGRSLTKNQPTQSKLLYFQFCKQTKKIASFQKVLMHLLSCVKITFCSHFFCS